MTDPRIKADIADEFEEREYRKTATVFAYKVQTGEMIYVDTLEGPARAWPGDYIATANTERREKWVVKGDVFEATYEPVADAADKAAGIVRVDTRDDATTQRIAQALAEHHGWDWAILRDYSQGQPVWEQARAVLAALRGEQP